MNKETGQIKNCRNCQWTGDNHRLYSSTELSLIKKDLKPGDTVPFGSCPCCGSHVYKENSSIYSLSSLNPNQAFMDWRITSSKIGGALFIHLNSKDEKKHVDITIEILGDKPVLHLNTGFDVFEDPLAMISILKDGIEAYPGKNHLGSSAKIDGKTIRWNLTDNICKRIYEQKWENKTVI